MSCFCPHCGYDLRAAGPVDDGPFRYDPAVGFTVEGVRLPAAPQAHLLLGTVMQAGGRVVSREVVANRMGVGEQADTRRSVGTILSLARAAVLLLGHQPPVETVFREGLRWNRAASPFQRDRVYSAPPGYARGERVPAAKLTVDDVRSIRRAWPDTKLSVLAAEYGVSEVAIYKAATGKSWAHVAEEAA